MLVIIFIGAMVVANLTIAAFGPWFSPINAFLLIGLDLVVRDRLHDKWSGKRLPLKMFGLISAAAVITYAFNPAATFIAVASVAAFVLAMTVNTAIYYLVHNKPWMIRSNLSNTGGAAADSVTFPTIAFGSLMPEIIALQFVCKVLGGFLWSAAFKKWGVVK